MLRTSTSAPQVIFTLEKTTVKGTTVQQEYEDGPIDIYVGKIQALGVRALEGENVEAEITAVISEAQAHFNTIKNCNPLRSLTILKGRLNIYGDIASESQPKYRETLKYAAASIDLS